MLSRSGGGPAAPRVVFILVVGFLVKIQKKSYSTHSSSKGGVNAYFLTGSFSKKTWLFEAVVLVG